MPLPEDVWRAQQEEQQRKNNSMDVSVDTEREMVEICWRPGEYKGKVSIYLIGDDGDILSEKRVEV